MDVVGCKECGEPLEAQALSCAKCGRPVEPETTKKLGPSVSLIGAVFVTVGPFLPWLTQGVTSMSGVEATKKAALIFVGLGVFGAMFSLSALTGKKFTGLRGNISAGIVGVALATYLYLRLPTLIEETELGKQLADAKLSDHFDKGLYFCIAGSVVLLVGGILTRSPRDKTREKTRI